MKEEINNEINKTNVDVDINKEIVKSSEIEQEEIGNISKTEEEINTAKLQSEKLKEMAGKYMDAQDTLYKDYKKDITRIDAQINQSKQEKPNFLKRLWNKIVGYIKGLFIRKKKEQKKAVEPNGTLKRGEKKIRVKKEEDMIQMSPMSEMSPELQNDIEVAKSKKQQLEQMASRYMNINEKKDKNIEPKR